VRPAAQREEQKQAIGISRGGRSTKIHAIVYSKGRPLNFRVTGSQVHDSQIVGNVLDTPRPSLAITADNAYDSEKVRQQIKDEGALPVFAELARSERPSCFALRAYPHRTAMQCNGAGSVARVRPKGQMPTVATRTHIASY